MTLYPRTFVAPDGRVFFATYTSRYLDTTGMPFRLAGIRIAPMAIVVRVARQYPRLVSQGKERV